MAKQGEVDYLKKLTKKSIKGIMDKPFSYKDCGAYLMQIGAIMSLLPQPPAKLLDLGCGSGWTSYFFAQKGYEVTGQDISEDIIYYANSRKDKEKIDNLNFLVGDYETISFEEEFDCVTFIDSLHHSISEEQAICMAYKALKPGGICIAAEPGIGHARHPESISAVEQFNVTERDMPPGKIIRAGKKAGFRKFKIYPHARHLAVIYREPSTSSWKKIFTVSIFKNLAAIFVIAFYKRNVGIVLMSK